MRHITPFPTIRTEVLSGKRYWKGWEDNYRRKKSYDGSGRVSHSKREVEIDFSQFSPDEYLFSWTTAVCGVETEKDGHCVAAGTRVLTDKGSQKIEELVNDPPEFILTEFGPQPFMGVSCSGIRETYRVRTAFGNNIRVTEKHRFQVLQADGTLTWRKVTELSAGDYLLCRRGDADMIPEDRGDLPELWEIIGNFYGDGSYSGRWMNWHVPECEYETLERVKNWFLLQGYREATEEEPGIPGEKTFRVDCDMKRSGSLFYTLRSYHSRIQELVPSYQKKGRWRDAGFPEEIWKCGKKQMRAFIRGLITTDGGGCFTNNSVSLTTTRWRVARDFGLLLSYLGIVCNTGGRDIRKSELTGKTAKNRNIYLRGRKSADVFLSEIGFGLSQKQDQLQINLDHRKNKLDYMGYHHVAPLVNRIFPRRSQVSEKGKFDVNDTVTASIRCIRNGLVNTLTDSMLPAFLDRAEKLGHDDEALQHLKDYYNNGWWFDQVKKVSKSGEYPVFDPVNVGTSSYVSNGIVSHNTIVSPHNKFINDNGNAWRSPVLLESYHSFILAENYTEHISLPEFSKGKVLDAVAWVVEKQFNGYPEPVPSVFIDCLLATNKKKHPRLVDRIQRGIITTTSMGGDVLFTQCSKCGKIVEEEKQDPCLLGESRVVTEEGYVKISDCVGKGMGSVLSESGISDFTDVVSNGIKKVFRVRTDSGNNLYATGNHRVKVLSGGGDVVWKQVDELVNGDYLLSRRGSDNLIPKDRGRSSDFWYVLGHLYGDGSREYRGEDWAEYFKWMAPEKEEESLERIERFFSERGIVCTKNYRESDDHGDIDRYESIHFLRTYYKDFTGVLPPFRKKGAWRVDGVPGELWKSGRDQIAAFLNGLFTTDGTVGSYGQNSKRLSFKTKYRKLAQDVKKLLLLFGVVTSITKHVGKTAFGVSRAYTVNVNGSISWTNFNSYIGFSVYSKSSILNQIVSQRYRVSDCLGYFNACFKLREMVPHGTRFGKDHDTPERRLIYGVKKGRVRVISDHMIERVISFIDKHQLDVDDNIQGMRSYVKYNWWFDRVKKVEEWGEREVFDILNSSTESYYSDGLISHNCKHISEQLGRYYTDNNNKKRRVSELCGVEGKPGSFIFRELSWVAKPAFLWAKLHGFLDYAEESTGNPLKAFIPYERYKEITES